MQATFNKRIFTFPTFKEAVDDVLAHLPDLKVASRGGRISRAFAERLMLAVTAVNGCRYCAYGHTQAALAAGVSPAEIKAIMAGEFGNLPQEEVIALMFGQHYAESKGNPDSAAWQRVVETYGQQTANDIMAYIRMIMFGNLWGNTFDALLSRLTFRPAPGSSLLSELGVLLGGLILIPAGIIRRKLGLIPSS